MTELVQSLVRGLGVGRVYALLALGFVIIYKSTRVISFAQPSLMLAGAVLVTYLVTAVNFYLAVLLAAAAVALLAVGVERAAIRPMVGRPAFVVSIITLGVDIVIRVVVNAYIGLDVRQVGDPWGLSTSRFLGIEVQQRHLAMFVTTVVLVAVCSRSSTSPGWAWRCGRPRTTRKPRWPRGSRWAGCSRCPGRSPARSPRSPGPSRPPAAGSTSSCGSSRWWRCR